MEGLDPRRLHNITGLLYLRKVCGNRRRGRLRLGSKGGAYRHCGNLRLYLGMPESLSDGIEGALLHRLLEVRAQAQQLWLNDGEYVVAEKQGLFFRRDLSFMNDFVAKLYCLTFENRWSLLEPTEP